MKAFLLAAALAIAFIPNVASAASTCNGRLDCIHDNPVSENVRSAVRSGGVRLHAFAFGRYHHYRHHGWRRY
jgi:hypothetical protein